MILRLQSGVSDAVAAMQVSNQKVAQTVSKSSQVGSMLEQISALIGKIADMNTQIAAASEQQTMISNEIERNIHTISEVANDTASGANNHRLGLPVHVAEIRRAAAGSGYL